MFHRHLNIVRHRVWDTVHTRNVVRLVHDLHGRRNRIGAADALVPTAVDPQIVEGDGIIL